jgi:SAM-dependent methyltransferase
MAEGKRTSSAHPDSPTLLERMPLQGAARSLVAKAWRRFSLRGIGANDNHAGLDRLYALPDPWGMDSQREQSRFVQTNAVIEQVTGRVGSLLEIGCGEGHQSEHLARLCDTLHGIDVSSRAVARACQRVPTGHFSTGHLNDLPWQAPSDGRYDLVVACEVLYYLGDIQQAVERMSALGRHCFATFFCPSARVVAQHLVDIPGLQRGWIYHEPYAWLWAHWRGDHRASS